MLQTRNHQIDSFISKVEMGVQWFKDAGEMLVRMLDKNPDIFTDILAQSNVPWITRDVLQVFESIGRNKLAVEAMFLPQHVLKRIIELPLSVQEGIATQPVPVVSGLREGTHSVIQKPAAKLTRNEAERAIGPKGIRPIDEQTVFVKSDAVDRVGRFTVFLMNGKPFIKYSANKGSCQTVLMDKGGNIEIEVVKMKTA
jgi:hypothetical protein